MKRCPFCGGDAVGDSWHFDHRVKCNTCGASTATMDSPELALQRWEIRRLVPMTEEQARLFKYGVLPTS